MKPWYRGFAGTVITVATIATIMFLASALFGQSSASAPGGFVTYRIVNYGTREKNVSVTFGAVFARGDVPRGSAIETVDKDGTVLPTQVDRKATNQDGSLRHAVLTVALPHLDRDEEMPVTLRLSDKAPDAGKPITPSDLPPDFDVVVALNSGGHSEQLSARSLLAAGDVKTWLAGPRVSEWWVSGPFKDEHGNTDPHLAARLGIRCYGKGQPVRIDIIVENDWTLVPQRRTEVYDAEIRLGGKTVFKKKELIQPAQTRWREGFWWGEPVYLYVKQDLTYLKKAGVIPNYDPDLRISSASLENMYERFQKSDRSPMGTGIVTKYMPTTGDRGDIGPLPEWQALYLLTMDPRAYEMTLQNADLGASFPVHYRNEVTERPITAEDYPKLSTSSDLFGQPGQLPKPDTGGYPKTTVPDTAHQPSLDFIPYLVTGDRFYLEELEFWSQWNAMDTAPEYRGYGSGLIGWQQPRGQAWSLRTLAQAEYITPDNDPLKTSLRKQLQANIEWYQTHFVQNPSPNKLHTIFDEKKTYPLAGGRGIAPFEDDFFTWTVDYVNSLGDISTLPLLRWKAVFPINRITAPGSCWMLAAAYVLIVRDKPTGNYYDTFDHVCEATVGTAKMGHASATMFSYLQAALAAAVDARATGANAALQIFASRSVKPDYDADPTWAIVPIAD